MFKYTKNGIYLTVAERQFYEDNGFIIKKNLVDHNLLDECRARFDQISETGPTTRDMFLMKEQSLKNKNVKGKKLIKNVQHLMHDEVFSKYGFYKPMVDVIESIIGPNITCCQSVMISKPPNAEPESATHPLHQDYFYFPWGPADSVVICWTATEFTNKDNGGLYVFPGTHKEGLREHFYSKNNKNRGYYEIKSNENRTPVYLTVEKGDTVFFHPLLLHGSGTNSTQSFRKIILFLFIDSNAHVVDFKGTQQEDMAKFMLKSFKVVHPFLKSYLDAWKYRSRLIRGPPGRYQRYLNQL